MTPEYIHQLINWYQANKREMPWRNSRDPYHIWLSEMMLQQTQVKTVIPYFETFIHLFPDIESLANAELETVLKAWEGLGYYSRARNLHAAANAVKTKHQSVFPENIQDIQALKGVGPYTAGAIASIAFEAKTPAVDGNVLRVISRVIASQAPIDHQKTVAMITDYLRPWYEEVTPSLLTQALMELGATLCKVKSPLCDACPLQQSCVAHKQGLTAIIPIKAGKTKQTEHVFQTGIIKNEANEYLIRKRPEEGLLASMYEFYQVEAESLQSLTQKLESEGYFITSEYKLHEIKHVFSHRIWFMNVYGITLKGEAKPPYFFASREKLSTFPMATAHKKILVKLIMD